MQSLRRRAPIRRGPERRASADAPGVHGETAQQQIQDLGRVFSQMVQRPGRTTNQGIIADGRQMVQEAEEAPLRNYLIDGRLKIEHVEIAVQSPLVQGTRQMGQQEVADLLQQNLEQEQQTARSVEQILIQQMLPQFDQQAMQTA